MNLYQSCSMNYVSVNGLHDTEHPHCSGVSWELIAKHLYLSEAGATFNFDNYTQMFPSSIPCFILQVVSLLHGNK